MDELERNRKREASVRSWVESNLVDGDWIQPSRVGTQVPLFSTRYSKTLYDALIDGIPTEDSWAFSDLSKPSSRLLFEGISSIVREHDACWVTLLCHDDAYLEVRRVIPAYPDYVRYVGSRYLQTEPADEAGTTGVALLFEDFNDLFLFTDSWMEISPTYPREYRIDYFGDGSRLEQLRAHMRRTLTEAQQDAAGQPATSP